MTNYIIHERTALINQIKPVHGAASEPSGPVPEQACVMQMAAWLAGEQWTDRPECVDPRLAALLREVNDYLPEDVLAAWAPQVAPLAVGVTDASALLDRLAVRRLRETVLPLAPHCPDELRPRVVAAIEQTIAAIESGDPQTRGEAAASAAALAAGAAESAAWSDAPAASWAAWSAARAAAWATRAARAAAGAASAAEWAASAAEWAAARAARSSAWTAEARRVLDELRREHNGDN